MASTLSTYTGLKRAREAHPGCVILQLQVDKQRGASQVFVALSPDRGSHLNVHLPEAVGPLHLQLKDLTS